MSDAVAAKVPGGLTPRDGEIVLAALQCVKGGDIQVDYAALCTRLGFKTEASARSAWCGVKRKLFGEAKSSATDEQGGATKPKTPRKAKDPNNVTPKSGKKASKPEAADKDVEHDSGDGESHGPIASAADGEVNRSEGQPEQTWKQEPATPKTPGTPKKRSRKTKAEKEAEAAANGEAATGEDDKDEKPAKKRRTPAKKKAAESENNAANEGEAQATPVKGKKAATPRKTAVTVANKAPAPAGPAEEEAAAVEVVNLKQEEDEDVPEANAGLPGPSTETANAPKGVTAAVDGSVCDAVNTAAEIIAAKATEVLAAANDD